MRVAEADGASDFDERDHSETLMQIERLAEGEHGWPPRRIGRDWGDKD
jgi:hypothetical protein